MSAGTTMTRVRSWTGPAVFSYGFRPFFLGAALWAGVAMALWLAMLTGFDVLPTALDPVSWHAHEFLFGYVGAVAAGFLMTAVPNWTGRMPIVGWPLAGLFGLWVAGRVAMAVSATLSPVPVAIIDLAFPVMLTIATGREIVAGRNWRNLGILGVMAAFLSGNLVFHVEAARGAYAAEGVGFRLGLAAVLMLIAVVGGRIVPSFTRNWLARRGPGRLPVPPERRFDRVVLLALLAVLAVWVPLPWHPAVGIGLVVVGLLHAVRLCRWAGDRTLAEPLVSVLHVAYAFVPLGALAVGIEILRPGVLGATSALHPWTAGAIGLMTLAVMTRATLGHTGQKLEADAATVAIYAAIVASVIARLLAGVPGLPAPALYTLSGAAWIAGFALFAMLYGRLLLRPRQTG